jgi:hypothetical protein
VSTTDNRNGEQHSKGRGAVAARGFLSHSHGFNSHPLHAKTKTPDGVTTGRVPKEASYPMTDSNSDTDRQQHLDAKRHVDRVRRRQEIEAAIASWAARHGCKPPIDYAARYRRRWRRPGPQRVREIIKPLIAELAGEATEGAG